MILRHDGLDRLWEDDVNWDNIDPLPENDHREEGAIIAADLYAPQLHDAADFEAHTVLDLIPEADILPYENEDSVAFKSCAFYKLIICRLCTEKES